MDYPYVFLVLSAALFDDEAAPGFDDDPVIETPRQDDPGGAFMVMATA
ncbi:hypothetical protein GCM10009715_39370 [Paeniglutamicibacter psychrophenolicus]|uniref:Uncharacterized protein n=1 Tax=Paeniglutamicibacter psychrophenolicus TaxID=257454 RepID=A0ABS4WIJ5_9MICC|nr:hypothetical protein [Paeniglutamicibacter psychrophenolicus]